MEALARLIVALVVLLLALAFASAYLAGPFWLLRKFGVWKAIRRFVGALWSLLVFVFQLVTKTRRLPIRRPGGRLVSRRAG